MLCILIRAPEQMLLMSTHNEYLHLDIFLLRDQLKFDKDYLATLYWVKDKQSKP